MRHTIDMMIVEIRPEGVGGLAYMLSLYKKFDNKTKTKVKERV